MAEEEEDGHMRIVKTIMSSAEAVVIQAPAVELAHEIVDMKRFCTAPKAPRLLDTSATAPSISCCALA